MEVQGARVRGEKETEKLKAGVTLLCCSLENSVHLGLN